MPLFRRNIRHNVMTLSRQGLLWDLRVIKLPSKSTKKSLNIAIQTQFTLGQTWHVAPPYIVRFVIPASKSFVLDVWCVTYQTRHVDS